MPTASSVVRLRRVSRMELCDIRDNHLGVIAAHAVAGVDMELGGRPGWPVDRHADQLSICADLSEELEQRLSVNCLSARRPLAQERPARSARALSACRRIRASLASLKTPTE